MRGVGITRAPSLYQFTAMPGRVFMSQGSFRMFPGSNRRCSVVSSLRSSRTSVKILISKRCYGVFFHFGFCHSVCFFLSLPTFLYFEPLFFLHFPFLCSLTNMPVGGLFLHLLSKAHSHTLNYDLQLFNPIISRAPTNTHTMKLPWRPGGLTHPDPPPHTPSTHPPPSLNTANSRPSLLTQNRKKKRKETWRKRDCS